MLHSGSLMFSKFQTKSRAGRAATGLK